MNARKGYTLFELIVVMAILILLAVIVIPSTAGLYGSTRPKAAADQIRGELAVSRAWAMEEGQPYRVAISSDGTRIKRAPEAEFDQSAAADHPDGSARRVEYAFDNVTASVTAGPDNDQQVVDATNWVTVAVVMPDGTCRDDGAGSSNATVTVREVGTLANSSGLQVVVRGVTGQTRIVSGAKSGGQP